MITIVKWSELFENSDMRKRQRLGMFSAPSGCDSSGYRKLMREGEQGLIALGFFNALCQAMATFKKDIRKAGRFVNSNGKDMDLADIQEITRIQVADCQQIVSRLEAIGWITQESSMSNAEACQSSAGNVPENSDFVQGEGEGEGEGQGDGEEDDHNKATLQNGETFTLQQALDFMSSNKASKPEFVEAWFASRSAVGWVKSHGYGVPMQIIDWKYDLTAYVQRWIRNEHERVNASPRQSSQEKKGILKSCNTEQIKTPQMTDEEYEENLKNVEEWLGGNS